MRIITVGIEINNKDRNNNVKYSKKYNKTTRIEMKRRDIGIEIGVGKALQLS